MRIYMRTIIKCRVLTYLYKNFLFILIYPFSFIPKHLVKRFKIILYLSSDLTHKFSARVLDWNVTWILHYY